MKTEINLENKARFIMSHWMPEFRYEGSIGLLRICSGITKNWSLIDASDGSEHRITKCFIERKPLSSITDEDAREVWDLLNPDGGNKHKLTAEDIIRQGKGSAIDIQYSNSGHMVGLLCVLLVIDYLRSKGYALPWMGLSVDEMVEAGWIKLIK